MLDITHIGYLNLPSFFSFRNRKERNFFGKYRNTLHTSKPKEAPSVLHIGRLEKWKPSLRQKRKVESACMHAAMMTGTVLMVSEFIGYTLFETLFDTPREEQSLRKIFPDEYEEYSKRVPRWIPRIRK